ncbi:bifunctional lysylphosphatidylglycerol flippase/synthetase MprF [Kineosporia sp. A_224]|uniref:bifunctional lysylphosphatidylglycerol flippase/synthetase MprF n=1 Tax=Kineosporia sp. A_224 TaxID=1962180 RepID=UPI001E46AD1C|nr:bifunctional lysylphosphatidylglycerol flippase/synthetase MprF [Kineosporia sp. A_224]
MPIRVGMSTSTTTPASPARLLRAAAPLLVLGVLAAAVVVLQRHLADYPWHRLGGDLAALGAGPVLLALGATAVSYGAMTGYDALALRYVEHPLPWRRYAAASFVATAFGNSLGASAVVGAALRARVYSAWAVPGFAVTRIIGFNLVTLGLGCALLPGVGAVADPAVVGAALGTSRPVALAGGAALLAAVGLYVAWSGAGRRPVTVRDWRVDRPSRPLALAQVALSTLEWLAMAAVLFVLLPDGTGIGFATFAPLFVVATVAGLVSNVPGGLGVFETVLLLALGGAVPPERLVTALVAYRFVYFLLPLGAAAVVLAGLEHRRDRAALGSLLARAGLLTPSVLALGVGGLGLVLVVTGDVPGDSAAPDMTAFTASLAGVLLLLLARGLHRRLHGAWVLSLSTLAAVLAVAATHDARGVAGTAALLVVLLVMARGAFHRTMSVLSDPRGWGWSLTVAASVSVLVWWHDLWTGSALVDGRTVIAASAAGDAPVHVRVGLAVGLVGVVLGGSRLQAPGRAALTATDDEMRRAGQVLTRSTHGNACLLWTGDKRVLFSGGGNALLMYQVRARSWVVMSDPVGDETEFDDLLARFVDEADRACGRPVLYSVREDLADLYRRHGLTLVKLGEEATVPLAGFSMEGKHRAKLRSECRASTRAGVEIEVVEPADVEDLLPELAAVSDSWLAERNAREKRFSLGAFEPDYVRRFPVVVARLEGRVVAFATLWTSGARHEVKIDLMRRLPDAPRTVMSHLFVEAMTWSRDAGYASFSLGMAPLSGLRTDGTGTFWDRAGHFLWSHGEHFYNFQGLRQFKERFDPVWETRYVASPGGPALPVMMLDVAALVAGGVKGLVAR